MRWAPQGNRAALSNRNEQIWPREPMWLGDEGLVGRFIPVDDEQALPDHARDAAGMFRHLVQRAVSAEDMRAAIRRRR